MISRRAFLRSASAVILARSFAADMVRAWSGTGSKPREFLLAPSLQAAPDGKSTWFSCLELPAGTLSEFPIPLQLAHSWEGNPVETRRGIVPESGGSSFCEIDLLDRKVVQSGKCTKAGWVLGGHALYSDDGKKLFLTEMPVESDGEGSISVRDSRTLQELAKIPTHGRYPHELALSEDGKSILVANLGQDPVSMMRVEIVSGKLLEKTAIRSDAALVSTEIGHEELLAEGSYFVQVAQKMITNRPAALVLHPYGKALSFWKLSGKERKLKRQISFAPLQPIAVTPIADHSRFAVALSNSELVFLKRQSLERDSAFLPGAKIRASTHLSNWVVK